MFYYEMLIGSGLYHGQSGLTYGSTQEIPIGSIVLVPMRQKRISAIVVKRVSKPTFKTKDVLLVQTTSLLPKQIIELMEWIKSYYPSPLGTIVSQLIPSNLSVKNTSSENLIVKNKASLNLPKLTSDQSKAIDIIESSPKSSALIHGDTGTGKTRIYLELAKKNLEHGKSVIFLTPEIGLTSQLASTVSSYLNYPVIVFHSNLSPKERRTLWLQVLNSKQPLVVIGPRSALFVPINNIGLIVIDEAHDGAYKQDQSPKYHAVRVAAKLAEIHQAKLILGTATPLISDYYFLKAKGMPIIRLTKLALADDKNKVINNVKIDVVNSRDRSNYTKNGFLSNQMIDAIDKTIKNGHQALVFLNRRGTARLVICQNCDWHALCPNCDLPLTYHGDQHQMRCHTCGFKQPAVPNCPVCGSPDIVYKSIGTKALADSLQKLFPEFNIKRFDTDNLQGERFEQNYPEVSSGKVDILVGTQMLVKGLDLPKLGMVGVVAADSSLYFPDYTAEEQTFQLITQVIGRVGRGHNNHNLVVIQTHNPGGAPLKAAIDKDWDSFYKKQLEDRKRHHFPPFLFTLKLVCKRKTRISCQQAATKLVIELKSNSKGIEIIGPSPSFIEQSGGYFHWQIIARAKKRDHLVSIVNNLPANWQHDLDPINLL